MRIVHTPAHTRANQLVPSARNQGSLTRPAPTVVPPIPVHSYTSYTYGPAGKTMQIILLDTRWFRSPLDCWWEDCETRVNETGKQRYVHSMYSVCPLTFANADRGHDAIVALALHMGQRYMTLQPRRNTFSELKLPAVVACVWKRLVCLKRLYHVARAHVWRGPATCHRCSSLLQPCADSFSNLRRTLPCNHVHTAPHTYGRYKPSSDTSKTMLGEAQVPQPASQPASPHTCRCSSSPPAAVVPVSVLCGVGCRAVLGAGHALGGVTAEFWRVARVA